VLLPARPLHQNPMADSQFSEKRFFCERLVQQIIQVEQVEHLERDEEVLADEAADVDQNVDDGHHMFGPNQPDGNVLLDKKANIEKLQN
jgi:hypothetical protein